MKFIYVLFFVCHFLCSAEAQLSFFGQPNEGVFGGIRKAVSEGISGGVQGLQSGLSKGLVGGITGLASGAAGSSLQSLTKSAFGDRENAKDAPALLAHSLTDGLTAGLDGLNNNLDKGVISGLTSFATETSKGLAKGVTTGAFAELKEMLKGISTSALKEFTKMVPELLKKYKFAIYATMAIAAIQTSAKLYHSVSMANQPGLRRVYDKIMTL